MLKRSHLKGGVLSNGTASSLSLLAMTLVLGLLFGMVSCKKSSGLSGAAPVAPGNVSSSTSASGTSTGTVFGGLTPVSGATVSLFQAGTNTAIATTTTNAQGVFNLPFTGASGLLYYKVTGGTPLGNPGGTSNSNIQMIGLVGSSSALPAGTIQINELTTAAFMTVAKLMGIVTDTGGTVTFSAPNNTATTNNIVTQINNLITNGQYASGLSTAQQQSLGTVANAIAGCVENSSSCSTLMSTATNPSGGGVSSNILDAAVNMLNTTSSTTIGSVYTLAQKSAPTTGFTLSGSAPASLSASLNGTITANAIGTAASFGVAADSSGNLWVSDLTNNNVLKVSPTGTVITTTAVGANPRGAAIDVSGNVWVANVGGNSVSKLTSAGTVSNTFTASQISSPIALAIDTTGAVWVVNNLNSGTVTELNSSGAVVANPSVGAFPYGVAIDASNNVWVANQGVSFNGTTVTELNSSGTTLGTFTVGTGPTAVAVDPSGNIWVTNNISKTVTKLSSTGIVLGTFGNFSASPFGMAIDSAGNVWVAIRNATVSLTELSSSGALLGSFALTGGGNQVAIDPSGNIWVTNLSTQLLQINALSSGPEFSPYTGPQFPFSI